VFVWIVFGCEKSRLLSGKFFRIFITKYSTNIFILVQHAMLLSWSLLP